MPMRAVPGTGRSRSQRAAIDTPRVGTTRDKVEKEVDEYDDDLDETGDPFGAAERRDSR